MYDYYKATSGTLIGDCISAKIESGIARENDKLFLQPFGQTVTLKAIEINKKRVQIAYPGSLCDIALHIPSNFDPTFIKSGNVLCDP